MTSANSRLRAALLPTAAFLAAGLLAGCGGSGSDAAETTAAETTATPVEETATTAEDTGTTEETVTDSTLAMVEEDVFDLSMGDCIISVGVGEVSSVETVDCSAPHEYEVYNLFNLEGDEYVDDAVSTQAVEGCLAQFEGFVGLSYEESIYGINNLSPTPESWDNAGDREVICLIGNHDGTDKVGSAAGTGL